MDRSPPYYLDMAASTPVARDVADLALSLMTDRHGNAGSRTHGRGLRAARELQLARERCASVAGCEPREVVFTSGATESNNLALVGLRRSERRHVVTTAIEHKAVLEPLARLRDEGFEVTHVRPDGRGRVPPDDLLTAIRPDTLLVSVMDANNETGAIQPVDQIAAGLPPGVVLHVDAAQTFGRADGGYRNPRVDLVSASGHKLHAPMGIGLLVVRNDQVRRDLRPLTVGGGQERSLRAGTVPVPLAAAFGLAAENAWNERHDRRRRCVRIRDAALASFLPLGPTVLGGSDVLPHILSIGFPGLDSEAVMIALRDVAAVANGSACTSASYEPSHVLTAMGVPDAVAESIVRFSWSHEQDDVPWELIAERVRLLHR